MYCDDPRARGLKHSLLQWVFFYKEKYKRLLTSMFLYAIMNTENRKVCEKMTLRETLIMAGQSQKNFINNQVFHLLADYFDDAINAQVFNHSVNRCLKDGVTIHSVIVGHIPLLFGRVGKGGRAHDKKLLLQITLLNLVVCFITKQITRERFDYLRTKFERVEV